MDAYDTFAREIAKARRRTARSGNGVVAFSTVSQSDVDRRPKALHAVQKRFKGAVDRMIGGGERLRGFPWEPNPYRPGVLLLRITVRLAPKWRTKAQKAFIKRAYENLNATPPSDGPAFMNYGYAPADQHHVDGDSDSDEQATRMNMQLYAKVASPVDLSDRDLLEVGCGPGGGSSYLHAIGSPRSVTGVDLATNAVSIASSQHRGPGLNFAAADAEHLCFADSSFDVVINVESSHCYPNAGMFFAEVVRVLRPGGHFLIADVRSKADVPLLRQQLEATGMVFLENEQITPGVVHALRLDSDRRRRLIEATFPRLLRSMAGDYFGIEGGEVFEQLRAGELEYVRLALRKSESPCP